MSSYRIIGLMSGSSLDGVDLALCRFEVDKNADSWLSDWNIEYTKAIDYPEHIKNRLELAGKQPLAQQFQTDISLAKFLGQALLPTIQRLQPDLLALHGHTTWHRPDQGISIQLGAGAYLAKALQIPVVSELRAADMEAGGQGAPLAPLADQMLFPGFDAYLNIGGIANVYLPHQQVAYDTGGANQLLNRLAQQIGKAYDAEGQTARSGKLLPALFTNLQQLDYFRLTAPKSLSNAWVQEVVYPLIQSAEGSVADKLHTVSQHIAWHVSEALSKISGKILSTGGGTRNTFLMELIQEQTQARMHIPEREIIDYKEAALVALLGLHQLLNRKTSIRQLTGARYDTVPGVLYLPPTFDHPI